MKKPTIIISLLIAIFLAIGAFEPQTQTLPTKVAEATTVLPQAELIAQPEVSKPTPVPPPAPKPKPAIPKKVVPKSTKKVIPPPAPAPIPDSCDSGSFNTQFLCLLNNYRKSQGLNTLVYDEGLNATAVDHSSWMNDNKTMSHTGLNDSKFYERCQQHNTTCDAENVAYGFLTAQKLFDAWKNSPGHNANILGAHTKTGLALVGIYATSLFK